MTNPMHPTADPKGPSEPMGPRGPGQPRRRRSPWPFAIAALLAAHAGGMLFAVRLAHGGVGHLPVPRSEGYVPGSGSGARAVDAPQSANDADAEAPGARW